MAAGLQVVSPTSTYFYKSHSVLARPPTPWLQLIFCLQSRSPASCLDQGAMGIKLPECYLMAMWPEGQGCCPLLEQSWPVFCFTKACAGAACRQQHMDCAQL